MILYVNYEKIKIKNTAVTRPRQSRTNAHWVSIKGWRVLGVARAVLGGRPPPPQILYNTHSCSEHQREMHILDNPQSCRCAGVTSWDGSAKEHFRTEGELRILGWESRRIRQRVFPFHHA